MTRLGSIFSFLLISVLAASAGTRFALVRFDDVTSELPSYKAAFEVMMKELDGIPNDPRNVQFQKVLAELNKVLTQIKELPPNPDQNVQNSLAAKADSLNQEAESLRREYDNFKEAETIRIKRKLLDKVLAIKNRVVAAAGTVAKARGIDYVFDSTGFTNTSMPVIVCNNNATDLTADVLAAVLASEPPPPAAAPAAPATAPAPAAPPAPGPAKAKPHP